MSWRIEPTGCCALAQLRGGNGDSLEDLKDLLISHGQAVIRPEGWVGTPHGGAPTLFCVASPEEKKLEITLRKAGFTPTLSIPRRKGYPEGMNTVWIYGFYEEEVVIH